MHLYVSKSIFVESIQYNLQIYVPEFYLFAFSPIDSLAAPHSSHEYHIG